MTTATEHIARTLLDARKRKGMSQRALADLAGVPQSHISKIESGAVDLRLSSLIELSRALGLELELVPRAAVPAVQSIVRSSTPAPQDTTTAMMRGELARLRAVLNRQSGDNAHPDQIKRIRRLIERLRDMPKFFEADLLTVANLNQRFKKARHNHPDILNEAERALRHLNYEQGYIGNLMQAARAYTLDDEGDDA